MKSEIRNPKSERRAMSGECLLSYRDAYSSSLSSIGWRRGPGRGGAFSDHLETPLPTPASWGEGVGFSARADLRASTFRPKKRAATGGTSFGLRLSDFLRI